MTSIIQHTRLSRVHLRERSAHGTVTLGAAARLWNRDRVDWPVSGDQTVRDYGLMRSRGVSLWRAVELHGILSDPLLSDD